MPRRKKRTRAFSKSRSKARKRLVRANIPRSMGRGATNQSSGIIGNRVKAVLSVSAIANVSAEPQEYAIIISGNGLLDPTGGMGNAQPIGYGELSAIFQQYTVFGSSIKVNGRNLDDQGLYVVIYPTTEPQHKTSVTSCLALPNVVYTHTGVGGSGDDVFSLSNYSTTAAQFGKSRTAVQNDDTFSALVTANPSELWNWNLQFFNEDNSSAVSISYNVVVTYYVDFFDPQQLILS